jgi:hypothetical protein
MTMRKALLGLLFAAPLAWSGEWIFDDSGPGISQDAGNTIKDESWSKEVTPRMQFACAGGGEIIASIDWQRFISSFNTEVGFKVDGGKFTWLKWKVDSSERITISPSASDTQKLLDALDDGSELLVDVTPYSESPVTVTFDLNGFGDSLVQLSATCQ